MTDLESAGCVDDAREVKLEADVGHAGLCSVNVCDVRRLVRIKPKVGNQMTTAKTVPQRAKKPTREQVSALLTLLEGHRELAAGRLTGRNAAKRSQAMWRSVAAKLNSLGGCSKTPPQWKKYWNDAKLKSKRAKSAARSPPSGTAAPSAVSQMGRVHERVLSLMGHDYDSPSSSKDQESTDALPESPEDEQADGSAEEMVPSAVVFVDADEVVAQSLSQVDSGVLSARYRSARPQETEEDGPLWRCEEAVVETTRVAPRMGARGGRGGRQGRFRDTVFRLERDRTAVLADIAASLRALQRDIGDMKDMFREHLART